MSARESIRLTDASTRFPLRTRVWLFMLAAVLCVSIVACTMVGAADIAPTDIWTSVLARFSASSSESQPTRDAIIWQLRLPRVLTAAAVGAGLALCGVIMQAVMRNPLADPYLLGLSSGASFGAVLVIVIGLTVALPFAAFGGSLLALTLALSLASGIGKVTPSRTLLAGIAVSAALGALTSLVIFWNATGDSYREILGWLLGSLAGATWDRVMIAFAALVLVAMPLMFSAQTLDSFAFGDSAAQAMGISVSRSRWVLLGATALLTGCLVAVSGAIGFVGLVVPHAARLLVGPHHRILLPLSALIGASFLLWSDTLARTLFDPREVPVGVVTALVGAPLFAVLLRARRMT